MRFLFGAAVRKPLIALAAVAIAVITLTVVKPWKAPEASEQARLAEHDSVWRSNPAAGFVQSKYVVLADAAWAPWGVRTTVVGRWYREGTDGLAFGHGSWTLAATRAGWTPSADSSCTGQFSKRLGKWAGVLTIAPDPTGHLLGVRIAFGSGGGDNGDTAPAAWCPR